MIPLHVSSEAGWAADVDAARRALGCEPLRRLEAATTDPLTPGRILRNVVAAPSLTLLRVPPDPGEAVAELCG